MQRLNGDMDIDGLIGALESAPFFAAVNVVLLKGTQLFREKKASGEEKSPKKKQSLAERQEERLMQLLADMPEYSYIIFEPEGKPDKRRKLYKAAAAAGMTLEAEAVRAWNINDWLQGTLQELGRELTPEAYA